MPSWAKPDVLPPSLQAGSSRCRQTKTGEREGSTEARYYAMSVAGCGCRGGDCISRKLLRARIAPPRVWSHDRASGRTPGATCTAPPPCVRSPVVMLIIFYVPASNMCRARARLGRPPRAGDAPSFTGKQRHRTRALTAQQHVAGPRGRDGLAYPRCRSRDRQRMLCVVSGVPAPR